MTNQCDKHADLRVTFVDSYQSWRPAVCPWCEIERLRGALQAMSEYRRVDGTRLDQGAGHEFAQYAAEVLASSSDEPEAPSPSI